MGVAVIDPHGDLIFDILNYIPEYQLKEIVYIDPESDRAPDLGIFDHPDKEKAIQAFMSLMEAHSGRGWGPETAHILRGATDAALEVEKHPSIISIYKILARDAYAKDLLGKSKNPLVQDFYKQYFEDLKPQERARNFSHPLNKIEELLRPGLREFLSQTRTPEFQQHHGPKEDPALPNSERFDRGAAGESSRLTHPLENQPCLVQKKKARQSVPCRRGRGPQFHGRDRF